MKKIFISLLSITIFFLGCTASKTAPATTDVKSTTTLIFVRHAEKADDGTSDPALTTTGQERAQRLATMLAPSGVDAVYSTPYKRTRLTGKPLTDQSKLELKEYDPRDQNFIATILATHPGETVVIVGHSNTIPMMVNSVIGKKSFEQLDEKEYDKLFMVDVVNGKGKALVLSF